MQCSDKIHLNDWLWEPNDSATSLRVLCRDTINDTQRCALCREATDGALSPKPTSYAQE